LNDGSDPRAQGVVEDPAWEAPLFRLFDAITETRGRGAPVRLPHVRVMCRWLARRGPGRARAGKRRKSEGVLDNLSPERRASTRCFGVRSADRPEGRLRVPRQPALRPDPDGRCATATCVMATETLGVDGPAGNAMTMMEVARDSFGRMPRVFGVNHHPEIIDRSNLMGMLKIKLARGEVTKEWYDLRMSTLAGALRRRAQRPPAARTVGFHFLGAAALPRDARRPRFAARARTRLRAPRSEIDRALTGLAPCPDH
jgi:hypothetical protein